VLIAASEQVLMQACWLGCAGVLDGSNEPEGFAWLSFCI
jgi:hypothetical protein